MSANGKGSGQLFGLEYSFDNVSYQRIGAVTTKSKSLTISNTDVTDDNSNGWNQFIETLRNETASFSGFTDTRSGADQGMAIDILESFSLDPASQSQDNTNVWFRFTRLNASGGTRQYVNCYLLTTFAIEGAVDGAISYSLEATSNGKPTTTDV